MKFDHRSISQRIYFCLCRRQGRWGGLQHWRFPCHGHAGTCHHSNATTVSEGEWVRPPVQSRPQGSGMSLSCLQIQCNLGINDGDSTVVFILNMLRLQWSLCLSSILNPLTGNFSKDYQRESKRHENIVTVTSHEWLSFHMTQFDWLKGSHTCMTQGSLANLWCQIFPIFGTI